MVNNIITTTTTIVLYRSSSSTVITNTVLVRAMLDLLLLLLLRLIVTIAAALALVDDSYRRSVPERIVTGNSVENIAPEVSAREVASTEAAARACLIVDHNVTATAEREGTIGQSLVHARRN